jgi:hypothetical protein
MPAETQNKHSKDMILEQKISETNEAGYDVMLVLNKECVNA